MYTQVKINVSDAQKDKIKTALEQGTPVSIRLAHEDIKDGSDVIALTNSQIKRMTKAYERGNGILLKLSRAQVVYNRKIEGGFLGMLAGLAARALPVLAKTILPALGVGALTGLASSGVQKAIGNGLYLKKGGSCFKVETDGHGLYLSPTKGSGLKGDGLYLVRSDGVYDGRGFISDIPIIGPLLKMLF